MQKIPKFLSLAPKNDLDKSIYSEALDFAINEDGIKNIAITGAYGAGKSSIIHSYIKKKECDFERKVVFVSLSSFNVEKKGQRQAGEESESISNEIQENKIETSILQQIISSVPKRKLPLSKISRAEDFNFFRKLYIVILYSFIVLAIGVNQGWIKLKALMLLSFIFQLFYCSSILYSDYKNLELYFDINSKPF